MARTKSVVLTMAEKNAILGQLKIDLKAAKQGVKATVANEAAHAKAVAKAAKEHEAVAKRRVKDAQGEAVKLQKATTAAQKAVAAVETKLNALMPPAPPVAV